MRTTPGTHPSAARASGPTSAARAHSTHHETTAGTRKPSGGRSRKRRSSPYADACARCSPNSPLNTSAVATTARATHIAAEATPSARSPAATAITAPAGTTARITVSDRTDGTSMPTATTPHPAQRPIVPVSCTGLEWVASASPNAAPPTTATANHTRRAAHTTPAGPPMASRTPCRAGGRAVDEAVSRTSPQGIDADRRRPCSRIRFAPPVGQVQASLFPTSALDDLSPETLRTAEPNDCGRRR